ncbi:MAG: endolytic transglycosylase MltG, partial [Muribaculaceae bacterium]|nr:endolytic transglycosylase MltG [Muribaculaceae bacterium]
MSKSHILRLCTSLVILAAAIVWAVWSYCHTSYEYEPTRVEIPAGTPADSISSILRGALGKHFGGRTAVLWKYLGGNPDASHGSYAVVPGDNAIDVANRIAKGRQTPVKFTFNNLRRFSDLASRAGNIMEFDSAAFMAAADSILAPEGFRPEQYSAAVLPDTYEFFWTASPELVISRIYEHRKSFWNAERKAKAKALGLTPEAVHTLASIVEEETANGRERPTVARLYINRLDKNMMLQADPTVKFALDDFS